MLEIHGLIGGKPLPGCPVSTIGGLRVPDIGWYSEKRFREVEGQGAFEIAPEICVEVLSPDNSKAEMAEKRGLYFDAGALEFWTCDLQNRMSFYHKDEPDSERADSVVCPGFPETI